MFRADARVGWNTLPRFDYVSCIKRLQGKGEAQPFAGFFRNRTWLIGTRVPARNLTDRYGLFGSKVNKIIFTSNCDCVLRAWLCRWLIASSRLSAFDDDWMMYPRWCFTLFWSKWYPKGVFDVNFAFFLSRFFCKSKTDMLQLFETYTMRMGLIIHR